MSENQPVQSSLELQASPASSRDETVAFGRTYCRESLKHIAAAGEAESANSRVLQAYTEQWATFSHLSGLVTHPFLPLEDHWIRREIDEAAACSPTSPQEIHHIMDLHAMLCGEEVLRGSTRIADTMAAVQQQDGEKEDDKTALEEVSASLSKVGLAMSDGS